MLPANVDTPLTRKLVKLEVPDVLIPGRLLNPEPSPRNLFAVTTPAILTPLLICKSPTTVAPVLMVSNLRALL